MTKLAPEWVRTSDPVIKSPARYRCTTTHLRDIPRKRALFTSDGPDSTTSGSDIPEGHSDRHPEVEYSERLTSAKRQDEGVIVLPTYGIGNGGDPATERC